MDSIAGSWEVPVAAAILTAAALGWSRRLGSVATLVVAAVVGVATWSVLATLSAKPSPLEAVTNRPVEVPEDGYVTSAACASCHPDQYASWRASYHRTMTQVVRPETVATELDGVTLADDGTQYRFERKGDEYFVVHVDERGRARRMPVVMSTGSHHMQIYWAATGATRRVELIPFHYLIEEDRWVPRRASFVIPPGKESFGTDWNTGCIFCHATRGQPRARSARDMDTRATEFGIACEQCHGPGREHVESNRDPVHRYRQHLGDEPDPTIVNPRRLSQVRSGEVCGRCHAHAVAAPEARRDFAWTGYGFEPGDDLSKYRKVLRLAELGDLARLGSDGRLWPDGMVRGSGREYGALLDSPCYEDPEFTCLSCHEMHQGADDPRPPSEWADDQLGVGMDGDAACLQCHTSFGTDVAAHTHHPPESSGSECMNCHMSYTTLGLMKAIRSHEVSSPSVASSLETGRPNACNQCHLNETLAWSAEHLERWYGQPVPELGADERTVAASLLWLLRGDAAQRALMAWSLGWEPAREASGEAWMPPYLAQLLADPYDVVRFMAYRSLTSLPGYETFAFDTQAGEAARADARRRALEAWQPPTNGSRRPSLLLGADGALDAEAFARLLAERDDRPVVVVE